MSAPFDPDAYLAKVKQTPRKPQAFDPDAYLEKARQMVRPVAEPGTPLEKALAEQSGDVVTVETPTGPAKFTRQGQRFYDAEESAQIQSASDAKLKERALEGGLSFLSGGGPMVDEFAGAAKALSVDSLGKNLLDVYRQTRDSARSDVASSTRNASPEVTVAGAKIPVLPALGAAAPSLLAPLPASWMGRIASSAAQGGEAAAGATDADLTRGEGQRFLAEVGKSAGVGALAAGGAEALTAPVRLIGNFASREAAAAKQAAIDATQAARDKALRSATSTMGGVASGGVNSIEKMEQVLANPSGYAPEVVREAQAMRALPEVQRAMDRAAKGNMDKLGRFIPDYEAAELARAEALARAQPAAVAAEVAAKTAPEAILKDVGGKAWTSVGQRVALGALGSTVGAGAGALMGEDWKTGGLMGAIGGYATPGTLQFLRNQLASPVVQYGANSAISKLIQETAGAGAGAARLVSPVSQASRPDPLEKDREAIQAFLSGG